jgi:imidazole glycerol-phosphate synthase subunit HisH
MLVIIDYGIGNLESVRNMLKRAGVTDVVLSRDAEDIRAATRFILPGVGHFDHCMSKIKELPYFDAFQRRVLDEKIPTLGVCVGCQMLFERSEEGAQPGLGWLPGEVRRFQTERLLPGQKVPHMSWAEVEVTQGSRLFAGLEEPRFYFVHSYHVVCADGRDESSRAVYGYPFTASVEREHLYGVQFHPEKSHRFGMGLLGNFSKI